MAEYASHGVGAAGLTTGIIGTSLGVLNSGLLNGGLGGLLGGNGWNNCNAAAFACSDNMAVNRYEATQSARIAELETEVKLRDANIYTDSKLNDLRNYMERRFDRVEHDLSDQKAFNAGTISTINCMKGDIAELLGLTKRIIPKESICPEYMQRYNSWVAPTATAQEAPAAG